MHLDQTVAHDLLGFFDARITQPPLLREARFNGHAGALRITDVVFVGLRFNEGATRFEDLGGFFASGETLHAGEFGAGEFVERAVGVKRVDDRELVAEADLEVHFVVGGRDLERTGGEGRIDRAVGDDRDLHALTERTPHFLPDEVLVTLVVRMHGDGDVGGDGFGARGFEDEVRERDHVAFGILGGGRLDEFVAQAEDVALRRAHLDLFVGKRGERNRAPVDHAFAAVDVALVKELHKRGEHGARVAGVHREVRAIPIAGAAEFAELLEYLVTLLVAP